jgi:hypothetical protein
MLYPLVLQCLGRCGLSERRVVIVLLRLSQVHRLVPIYSGLFSIEFPVDK